MKRPKKKLVLDLKTIRNLAQKDLQEVVGGSLPTGSGKPNCIPPP